MSPGTSGFELMLSARLCKTTKPISQNEVERGRKEEAVKLLFRARLHSFNTLLATWKMPPLFSNVLAFYICHFLSSFHTYCFIWFHT